MSCYLTEGGPKSIFPLRPAQIERLTRAAIVAAREKGYESARIDPRVGAVMKPDGTPIYLATWVPSHIDEKAWIGGFYTEMGQAILQGAVTADNSTGTMETSARVNVGDTTLVEATWTIQGPAVGRDTANVAGMMVRLTIANPGPHDEECLKSCLTLHAPDCVPLTVGREAQTVACAAAVAASCLINCRC